MTSDESFAFLRKKGPAQRRWIERWIERERGVRWERRTERERSDGHHAEILTSR